MFWRKVLDPRYHARMTSTSLPSHATAAFAPTASSDRLDALDVLRGFALVGICVANIEFFNRPVVESGNGMQAGLHGLDWLVAFLVAYLVSGKFWTIFSLLFGMGFALMQERARLAGRPFLPAYGRRIAALGAIGLLHHTLLWSGDILTSYAVGALALMLALFAPGKTMLAVFVACVALPMFAGLSAMAALIAPVVCAVLVALYLRAEVRSLFPLTVAIPGLLILVAGLLDALGGKGGPGLVAAGALLIVLGLLAWRHAEPVTLRPLRAGLAIVLLTYGFVAIDGGVRHFSPPVMPPAAAATSDDTPTHIDPDDLRRHREQVARSEEEKAVLTGGSHLEAAAMRLRHLEQRMHDEAGFAVLLLGVFLVGGWFVRSGIVIRAREHLPLWRRLAWGGIVLGVGLGLLGSLVSTGRPPGPDDGGYDFAAGLAMLGSLPAAVGYIAAVLLMLHGGGALSRIRILAPFGRMALSNYLMQSLVFALLFYGHGLGLWGMGRAAQVGVALLLCALQVGLSRWWLARFQYGPAEWMWRAVTYLTWPPMRRVG